MDVLKCSLFFNVVGSATFYFLFRKADSVHLDISRNININSTKKVFISNPCGQF